MSETALRESFRAVGKEYGYDDVDAEFASFKELKIKWQRSRGKADFKVSDYLADADGRVLEDMARALFSRIAGNEMRSYPESMNAWITSDDFVRSKQPVYIRRSRNLSRSHAGEHRDLRASCARLTEQGLLRDTDSVYISWTRDPNIRRVGYCSVVMKVIAISSIFDNPAIPEFVLDYVVYHEFLHIMQGFNPFGRKHGSDFKTEERKYPEQEDAENWLRRLRLYL